MEPPPIPTGATPTGAPVSNRPRINQPQTPPEVLSIKVADLLSRGDVRQAVQETLLALANVGNGGSRLDLYETLFKVIPHANELECAKLLSLLPPLLSQTDKCHDEQRRLALALGEWYVQQGKGRTLKESFATYQKAMRYFGIAIKIAQIQSPELYHKAHRSSSRLLMHAVHQYLVQNQAFKSRLENSRCRGNAAEVKNAITSIPNLIRFCIDQEDRQRLLPLYAHVIAVCGPDCPEEQRPAYAEHRLQAQQESDQFQNLPLTKARTEHYCEFLEDVRAFFRSYNPPKPNQDTTSVRIFCDDVRNFQKLVTERYVDFFRYLLDDAFAVLGPPPCKYDFRAMGSLGREEPCPFSDLECMILIEKESDAPYFQALVQFLQLQLLSLGETSSSDLIFPCLGQKNRSGMHLDFASRLSDIIGLPEQIASKQAVDASIAGDPNDFAHTALKSFSLASDDPSLCQRYLEEVDKRLNVQRPDETQESHFRALKLVESRSKDFEQEWKKPSFATSLQLKSQFVGFLHYLLADLSLNWKSPATGTRMRETNTLEILKKLPASLFTDRSLHLLKEAVALIYTLRISVHLSYEQQNEEAYLKGKHPEGPHCTKGVIDPSDWDKLQCFYFLLLKPLYAHIARSLIEKKQLEVIFRELDLIQLCFDQACEKSATDAPQMIFQIADYLNKRASLEEHLKYFRILAKQPNKELCESYLKGFPDPRLQLLLQQLSVIEFPGDARVYIQTVQGLDLSKSEDQEKFLALLFQHFPTLQKLHLLRCDLTVPQMRPLFSKARQLNELQLSQFTKLTAGGLLELLHQFPLHLILGQHAGLSKEDYLTLFNYAWNYGRKISLKDRETLVERERLYKLLQYALEFENEALAAAFIALNSEILRQKNSDGATLLHIFAAQNSRGLEILLKYPQLINEKSKKMSGYTPLHYAASAGIVRNMELLCAHHASLEEVTLDRVMPLHVAVRQGHGPAVTCLLRLAPNTLTACTSIQQNVFHIAVEHGKGDVLAILVQHVREKGLDLLKFLHAGDEDGKIPLHLALFSNPKPEMVKFLLDCGVNVNTKNKFDYTALHWAASHGHLESARLLCQRGALQLVKNFNGATPLDLAISWRQPQLAEYLRNPGGYVPQTPEQDPQTCYARFKDAFAQGHAEGQCQHLIQMASIHCEKREFETAASLYTSALGLARQYGLNQEMRQILVDMETLEGLFVSERLGTKSPGGHRDYLGKWQDLIKMTREHIQETIEQSVERTLASIEMQYRDLLYLLCQRCLETLELERVAAMGQAKSPTNSFALFVMGSWSRAEICPFDEVSFGIVIEKDTPQMRSFITKVRQLLELKMCHLGETPYNIFFPKPEQEALGGAFSITPKGFCKRRGDRNPLERSGIFSFTGTMDELAALQNKHKDSEEVATGILEELTTCRLFFGDNKAMAGLAAKYQNASEAKANAIKVLKDQLKQWEAQCQKHAADPRTINLQQDLCRPLQRTIRALCLYFNGKGTTTFHCLDLLLKMKKLTPQAVAVLKGTLSKALGWRIRIQLHYGQETEICYYQPNQTHSEKPLYLLQENEYREMQEIRAVIQIWIDSLKKFGSGNEAISFNPPNSIRIEPPRVLSHALIPSGRSLEALCLDQQDGKNAILKDRDFDKRFPHYYQELLITLQRQFAALMHKHGENPHLDTADTLNKLGTIYALLNDYRNSLDCLRRALLIYEKCPECETILERLQERRLDTTFTDAEAAIATKLCTLLNNRGVVACILNEAVSDKFLEDALTMARLLDASLQAKCHFNFGYILEKMGNFEQALDCFKESLRGMRPDNRSFASITQKMGLIHVSAGRYVEGMQLLSQALDMYRQMNPRPDAEMGFLFDQLGKAAVFAKQDQAERYFQDAVDILQGANLKDEKIRMLELRGQFWESQKNWIQADNCYDLALNEIGPQPILRRAELFFRKGECVARLENHPSAIVCFEESAAIRSKHPGQQTDLGITFVAMVPIYVKMKSYEKALDCTHKALKIVKQNPELHLQILLQADALYAALRKSNEAIPYSYLAIELSKKYYKNKVNECVDYLTHVASGWESRHEIIRAAFYYRQLLELYRTNPKDFSKEHEAVQLKLAVLNRRTEEADARVHALFQLPLHWNNVCMHLSYRAICQLGQVSRHFQKVVNNSQLFQNLLRRDFPALSADLPQSKTVYQKEFILRNNLLHNRIEGISWTSPDLSSAPVNFLLAAEGKLYLGFEEFIQILDCKKRRWLPRLEGCVRSHQGFLERNGRLFATTKEHTIGIWNASTQERLATLSGHTEAVVCLLQEGDRLYSGSHDRTIRIWDLTSNQSLACLNAYAAIRCLLIQEGKMVAGTADNKIHVWKLPTLDHHQILSRHHAPLTRVCMGNSRLFSLAEDGTVEEWDLNDNTHKRSLIKPAGEKAASLLLVGNHLYTGLRNGWICIWDITKSAYVATLKGHKESVNQLIEMEGKLYSGSSDTTIRIWDLQTVTCLGELPSSGQSVSCLLESGGNFYSASGNTVKLWDFFPKKSRKGVLSK